MSKSVLIKKLNGELEPFDESKLRYSLERSGASKEITDSIVTHVVAELSEGMTTDFIYKHAFSMLKKKEKVPAARYSLKRAVMELGPTGFPFERFVAEILKTDGYKVSLGQNLQGKCALHEVDVIAEKGNRFIVIEAKFHNELKVKSDLKVALYVKARFDDLMESNFGGRLKEGQKAEGWVLTNTDFTRNAIKYGKCSGLNVIGWSHSTNGESLQDLIEKTALHPLTALTTLSGSEKKLILETGHVLCRDVKNKSDILGGAGFSEEKVKSVLSEIAKVCVPR